MSEHLARIKEWTTSGELSREASDAIQDWLTDPKFQDFKTDVTSLITTDDLEELEDAFRTKIAFGTGGIRGKMGAGPNRINLRTIGEAAQGLSQYISKALGSEGSLAIAYDTRNNSDVFAKEVASIAAGNGVTTYLFDAPRATPELSFAVRKLGATAGVVISASHNPPRDNGFKAYWSDGGQVVPPHDRAIIEQVDAIDEIVRADFADAQGKGLIQPMPADMDEAYVSTTSISLGDARDIKIVFTPLHGVGATSIVPSLSHLGFSDLHVVDQQNDFDGNFPTVSGGVANPEDPNAMTMAIAAAKASGADIVMASDPDADRLGCALPLANGSWDAAPAELALNGNQIGVLLCHHLLDHLKKHDSIPTNGTIAKTIVTTDLVTTIAKGFGVNVVDNLLVGFKYIAQVISELVDPSDFIFGTEESHGYLATPEVRDKDAASAAMILADCAATRKAEGSSIRAYLDAIYSEFGYYREIQKSVTREGASGNRDIAHIMKSLREAPPSEIAGRTVALVIDRQAGTATDPKSGSVTQIDGECGNVLAFTFTESGNSRVTARPSGTEPKIKYYVSATSQDLTELASDDLATTQTNVDRVAGEILDGIVAVAEATLSE